jgi:hypothetical protein
MLLRLADDAISYFELFMGPLHTYVSAIKAIKDAADVGFFYVQ